MDENKEITANPIAENDNTQSPETIEEAVAQTEKIEAPSSIETREEKPVEVSEETSPVESEVALAPEGSVTAEAPTVIPTAHTLPVKPEKVMWSYARQLEEDKKKARKKGRRGALIYAIIMTSLFLICFATLAVLLIIGGIEGISPPETEASRGEGMAIADLVKKVEKSVVTVSVKLDNGGSLGSGFVFNDQGYILTNYHVVDGGKTFTVIDYKGNEYNAQLIDGDEIADVAVLYVKNLPLPKVNLGDSTKVIVGEEVVAIGTPLDIEYAGTVTNGIVSGVDRVVSLYDDAGFLSKTMTLIQTNTTLNPGNSGGPLFNMAGEVIGINTLKHASSTESDINYEGIGFAIRINDAIEIATDIIEDGKYSGNKGSASQGVKLGIKCGDVIKNQRIEVSEGVFITPKEDGVIISSVEVGYPAYGKLQALDIIVSFNGVKTPNVDAMTIELYKCKVGDKVTLGVYRDGELITVEIVL